MYEHVKLQYYHLLETEVALLLGLLDMLVYVFFF